MARLPSWKQIQDLFREPTNALPMAKPRAKHFDIDPDDAFYRRISSPGKNDVNPYLRERAVELSIKFYTENLVAARIIRIPIEAMQSAGMKIIADDPRAQECLNDFWGDDVSGFGTVFWEFFKSGQLTGELHVPAGTIPGTAFFDVSLIDTQNVVDVQFNPGNCLVRESITVKTGQAKQDFEILNKNMLVPPRLYHGDVLSFFYNLPILNFKRGIPTLFASIDYLDLLEQYMFNETERASTMRLFVWEFILKNKTDEECRAWYDEHFADGKPPAPQSVHVHNANVEMKAISPELRAGEIKDFSRTLRNHITGGVGYPEFFFGWGDNTNVATAREQNIPAAWKIESQQNLFVSTLSPILGYRLECAKAARYVTTAGVMTPDTSTKFNIVMKPVIPRDLARFAGVLSTVLSVMKVALEQRIVTRRIAIEMTSSLLENFGMNYDANAIEKELDAELKANDDKGKKEAKDGGAGDKPGLNGKLVDDDVVHDDNGVNGFHFMTSSDARTN